LLYLCQNIDKLIIKKLKIAIGYEVKESSWGGGNQFANSLVKASREKGFEVSFDLKEKDIDIILLTDPRSYTKTVSFGSFEIIFYLLFKNNRALVVHRINECDERKNTKYMNSFLKWANYCADYTVFISSWLRNLDLYQKDKPSKVILNGADKQIFRSYSKNYWDGNSPLKIVTHHWSPNNMKGWDVYKKLDDLMSNSYWRNLIEFTYIGNLPEGFKFKNSRYLKPMNGNKLGEELSKHDLYISASINEPAGMHHIEGILCGLPIIYRNSGALPEYCNNYGISFKDSNYLPALKEIMVNYNFYKKNVSKYPNTADQMTKEYLDLFSFLLKRRDEIIKKRNLLRSPFLILNNFFIFLIKSKNVVKLFNKIRK